MTVENTPSELLNWREMKFCILDVKDTTVQKYSYN